VTRTAVRAVRDSRTDVRRFLELPFNIYRHDRRWVPPLHADGRLALDRARHPFYEHSDATFLLAERDGHVAGRLGVIEHRPYNRAHATRHASFTMFECLNDIEIGASLFDRAAEWARARGLTRMVGPRGLGALDGYGILIDGFDRPQLMTMTNYNPRWYPEMLEGLGFGKEVDFVSYELDRDTFVMPDTVRRAAAKAGSELRVVRYPTRRKLVQAARRIGETYNRAFVNNWEYYPLTAREVDFVVKQVRPLADPRLMTFIAAGEEIVGFVLAFPDVSDALKALGGRLTPWGIARLLHARARATRVALNGAGIVPEFQGHGGNALLYLQIERAVRESRFRTAELPQVAETAVKMRADLERLGARPIKTHRVFARAL
jgi:GNAT superfamily N-acetyltransferase